MCGIAGIFGENRDGIETVLTAIKHRGPDAFGIYKLDNLKGAVGHVRLSIIDLDPRSNQPFISECGRYILVFNGEIYNYKLLKAELSTLGYKFRTESDTEVLLYWMINKGTEGIQHLDGMFSIGFIDRKARTLLLARDHIGEKPLYYSYNEHQGSMAFCSEIKGLLQVPHIDKTLNMEALEDYLRFLYTAPPHTFYKGISELQPGSYFKLDLSTFEMVIHPFYDLEKNINQSAPTENIYELFRKKLDESVSLRLQSDVPICIYLSGGLDSNALMASAREQQRESSFHTYTIKYTGSKFAELSDESAIAKKAAIFHGATNTQIEFSLDRPFLPTIQYLLNIFDQPFGNSTAIVSEMLAKTVSQNYRVAIVGDGGDEVAVGYPRYKALLLHQKISKFPTWIQQASQQAINVLPQQGRLSTIVRRGEQFLLALKKTPMESFLDWSTYLDNESIQFALGYPSKTPFYQSLLATFERNANDLLRAASIVDLKSFVPFNLMQCADRTSMHNSLELRSPFLSPTLIHYALGLPYHDRFRYWEKKPLISKGYVESIPSFILKQHKKPFNPPINEYLRRNIDLLEKYILSKDASLPSLLNRKFLANQMSQFRSGKKDNATFLWGLAILECWLRGHWQSS